MSDDLTVVVDGIRTTVDVSECKTASEINDLLTRIGIDTHRVSAMTVCDELLERLQIAEWKAEQLREANALNHAWANWFEQMRGRYEGMARRDEAGYRCVRWASLEEALPWPSLEDERAEAWEDE